MKIFKEKENRLKCGKCGTEFDLNQNPDGCPLCKFGSKKFSVIETIKPTTITVVSEYISVPPSLPLKSGQTIANDDARVWGSWPMFNSYYPIIFTARVIANMMKNEDKEYIDIQSFIEKSIEIMTDMNLYSLRGFPSKIKNRRNLQKDSAIVRFIHHFIRTGMNMGLFSAKQFVKESEDLWFTKFSNIGITVTKEGLEFARLKNPIFDERKTEQVLSSEERDWIINHLKKIDKEGYKEYTAMKDVYDIIKKTEPRGKNIDIIWNWFEENPKYQALIRQRIQNAGKDKSIFHRQMENYAKTFVSTKISLIREFGLMKNKRGEYNITGEI